MLKVRSREIENEWCKVWENIEDYITREEVELVAEKAKKEIAERVKGLKTAVSWSGGKDSIVIENLCDGLNVENWFIALSKLEYPEFERWIDKNAPAKLDKMYVDLDIKWLSENPQMLFPDDSKTFSKWYSLIQHKIQRKYCKDNGIEILLLGRRKKDNNYVGKNNEYLKNGTVYYSPIADWSHEEVLGYIHYNKIPLPEIYDYVDGFTNGTHAWPSRGFSRTLYNTWQEIYDIDKGIIQEAKDFFEEAEDVWEANK